MQALIWGLKCLLSMLRCMLESVKGVKSKNPKGEGEFRKWDPTLKSNIGKFNLSHIWDRVLLNTKGLTLNKQGNNNNNQTN